MPALSALRSQKTLRSIKQQTFAPFARAIGTMFDARQRAGHAAAIPARIERSDTRPAQMELKNGKA